MHIVAKKNCQIAFKLLICHSQLLSFWIFVIPNYCHSQLLSFGIIAISNNCHSECQIPNYCYSQLFLFQILFILNSSCTILYPKCEKRGRPYLRVLLNFSFYQRSQESTTYATSEGFWPQYAYGLVLCQVYSVPIWLLRTSLFRDDFIRLTHRDWFESLNWCRL